MLDTVQVDDKIQYYSLDNIHKKSNMSAHYYMIFGERSNGKTFSVLELMVKNFWEKGEQGVYLRRYEEHIKGNRGKKVFAGIVAAGIIEKITDGEWTGVEYYNREYYFSRKSETNGSIVKHSAPFCMAMAVSQAESYKGNAFPYVTTLCFDEFLTRDRYMIDEYVEFNSIVSTITRLSARLTIYLLGNTVNYYSPYFDEMGIDITDMKPGDIKECPYGRMINGRLVEGMLMAEYVPSPVKEGEGKDSDVYFAFENKKLSMITEGAWELPLYPHSPMTILGKNIIETFFIDYRDIILQGDIVMQDDSLFIYIHLKTGKIKEVEKKKEYDKKMRDDPTFYKQNKGQAYSGPMKMVYSLNAGPGMHESKNLIGNYKHKLAERIGNMFLNDLVYYQNNAIGMLVADYIDISIAQSSYRKH